MNYGKLYYECLFIRKLPIRKLLSPFAEKPRYDVMPEGVSTKYVFLLVELTVKYLQAFTDALRPAAQPTLRKSNLKRPSIKVDEPILIPEFDDIFEVSGSSIKLSTPKPTLHKIHLYKHKRRRLYAPPDYRLVPKLEFTRYRLEVELPRGDFAEDISACSVFSSLGGSAPSPLGLTTGFMEDAEAGAKVDHLVGEFRGNSLITPFLLSLPVDSRFPSTQNSHLDIFLHDLLSSDIQHYKGDDMSYYVARTFWQILFLASKEKIELSIYDNSDVRLVSI